MDTRYYDLERAKKQDAPIYHVAPDAPDDDPQGALGAAILRELLAIPPAVLDRPVFRKVQGPLKTYREHYVDGVTQ